MKVRRTISIDRGDLEFLKPFLEANGNNLSLALRQMIEQYRQKTDQNNMPDDQQKMMILRNQIIENRIAQLIPVPLIKWLVRRNTGVPPLGTFRVIMEKYTRMLGLENLSVKDYVRAVLTHSDVFGYRHDMQIEVDSGSIRFTFESEDSEHLKSTVMNHSCLVAHNPLKLKTVKVMESPNLIMVDYEQCSSEEEAYRSVMEHFGCNQLIFDEIQNNTQFWKNLANILKADHYEDVVISRDILLRFLKLHDFSDHLGNLIPIIYGVSIEDTAYQDVIRFIEEISRTNGLIHRIEHDDNEMRIHHKFSDGDIIRIVNETIIKTLEMSGQHFVIKKGDKMTILNRK